VTNDLRLATWDLRRQAPSYLRPRFFPLAALFFFAAFFGAFFTDFDFAADFFALFRFGAAFFGRAFFGAAFFFAAGFFAPGFFLPDALTDDFRGAETVAGAAAAVTEWTANIAPC
jgi:hypothetical protein